MIRLHSLAVATLLAACGDGSRTDVDDDTATCALSPQAQALLELEALRTVIAGTYIVGETHMAPARRAYARNLVGTTMAHMGSFSLAEACTAPVEYVPYCEECEAEPCSGPRRCSHYVCADSGAAFLTAWWEDWEGGAVSYEADEAGLAGAAVSYVGAPTAEIHYVELASTLSITWSASDVVTADVDGTIIDLASELEGSGSVNADGPLGMGGFVTYAALGATFVFGLNEVTGFEGALEVDGDTLAELRESSDHAAELVWLGGCAR